MSAPFIERVLAILALLGGAGLLCQSPHALAEDDAVIAALDALDREPGDHGEVLGIMVPDDESLAVPSLYSAVFLGDDYPYTCHSEIALLVTSGAEIEQELLDRIGREGPFARRYRPLFILAVREPAKAAPIIRQWWKHAKPLFRFAAWRLANEMAQRGTAVPLVDRDAILGAYQAEQEWMILCEIAEFVGTTRSAFAVDALARRLASLEKPDRRIERRSLAAGAPRPSAAEPARGFPGDPFRPAQEIERKEAEFRERHWIIRALGVIGERRGAKAVASDWRAHPEDDWVCCHAMGMIGSREAVDFLIARLPSAPAVEALGKAREKRALAALTRLRAELEQRREDTAPNDGSIDASSGLLSGLPDPGLLGDVRIALIQIADPHPAVALVEIAENRAESEYFRLDALRALESFDISALVQRIVRLGGNTDESFVYLGCAEALIARKEDRYTDALLELLDRGPSQHTMTSFLANCAVLGALNRRLGTAFCDDREILEYARTRR